MNPESSIKTFKVKRSADQLEDPKTVDTYTKEDISQYISLVMTLQTWRTNAQANTEEGELELEII
jgi:hypothetical protein